MTKRIMSGLVGIGLFLALCFGGALPYSIAAMALGMVCAQEWRSAYKNGVGGSLFQEGLPFVGALYPLALYIRIHFGEVSLRWLALLPALLVIVFSLLTIRAMRGGPALGDMRRFQGLVGACYIGLCTGSLVLLRSLPGSIYVYPFGYADRGAWLMLLTALCVWMSDTAAFVVGRKYGRRKLSPRLSPGKTVEGALGGLFGSLIVGLIFGLWFHLSLIQSGAIGGLAGTMGQAGDLWESSLKRELEIKDFGTVIPGHGGALDRFDSLFFVAPLAALLMTLVLK